MRAHVRSRTACNVLDRIAAAEEQVGREAGSVRLLAATKTRDIGEIMVAIDAGVRMIGERPSAGSDGEGRRAGTAMRGTRVFAGRSVAAPDAAAEHIPFHLIGASCKAIKIGKVLPVVDTIESVDSNRFGRKCRAACSITVGRRAAGSQRIRRGIEIRLRSGARHPHRAENRHVGRHRIVWTDDDRRHVHDETVSAVRLTCARPATSLASGEPGTDTVAGNCRWVRDRRHGTGHKKKKKGINFLLFLSELTLYDLWLVRLDCTVRLTCLTL